MRAPCGAGAETNLNYMEERKMKKLLALALALMMVLQATGNAADILLRS